MGKGTVFVQNDHTAIAAGNIQDALLVDGNILRAKIVCTFKPREKYVPFPP